MTLVSALGRAAALAIVFTLFQLHTDRPEEVPSAASEQTPSTLPLLPQLMVDTNLVPPAGSVIPVPSGGNLQAALDVAQPGSMIVLQAGATYSGNFTLPAKSGAGWIYIQSSALSSLPASGTRVSPVHASLMPKIVSPNASPAIITAGKSHHFRLIGIEVTATGGTVLSVVNLSGSSNVIVDRCYVHGNATGNIRHGVIMNGAALAVIDSYISDFHHTGEDATAIIAWDSPGPLKIANNYLEGATENVLFGGQDPSSAWDVPSDIEIRGNYFYKPLSWREGDPKYAGRRWTIKNLLELKNARRVLVDGNVFENNWTQADQGGFAVLVTPRNQNGMARYSTVQDVTFTNNVVRRSTAGFNILGWDNLRTTDTKSQRILIRNNLGVDIGIFPDSRNRGFFTGMLLMVSDGPANLIIDHNTFLQQGAIIHTSTFKAHRWPARGFAFTNNLTSDNPGVPSDDPAVSQMLATHFPNAVFARNVVVGGTASRYPADNFFPASLRLVDFTNLAGGDYHLAASSPYRHAGTDGKDVGADLDALAAAIARWQRPLVFP